MDVNAARNGGWTLSRTADRTSSRRDPAAAMAQGIVVGALGGLGLWALVGAVVMSVF